MSRSLVGLGLLCLGCFPSNVVAPEQRSVEVEETKLEFRTALAKDLPGFYESTDITGEAAGALLRAYYYFDEKGTYSGAALVVGEEGPQFLVIAEDGTWTLDDEGLDLHDDSGKVKVRVAEGHLRLETDDSAITFRRVELR